MLKLKITGIILYISDAFIIQMETSWLVSFEDFRLLHCELSPRHNLLFNFIHIMFLYPFNMFYLVKSTDWGLKAIGGLEKIPSVPQNPYSISWFLCLCPFLLDPSNTGDLGSWKEMKGDTNMWLTYQGNSMCVQTRPGKDCHWYLQFKYRFSCEHLKWSVY